MKNIRYVLSCIWNDKVLRYLLMASLIIVILMVVYVTFSVAANKTLFYTIPKGTQVLAFLGDPYSLDLKPIRLTSYKDQTVLLFHKRSGRSVGMWAFYVRGFVHLDLQKGKVEIASNGYFIIQRRKVRSTGWR